MSGGTPLGNMVIKLGLDSADFGRGAANAKKEVRYLAKEMQANAKIADMAGNQMGKLGTRFDGLSKIISAQEKQVTALKKAYDESFVDGKATESTKRLATQLQDANGKLANYRQQLAQTAGQLAEMQVKTTGATGAIYNASEKMIASGQRMEKVGSALTKGLTLPLAAGVTAVTTAAVKWESAFAGVKKTNDEVVDSTGKVVYSYKDLENGLRGLSKELPASHQEIAQVAEAAGQLGIQTKNVVGFTKTMIDLGESTNMSSEEAATALARLANITGMPQTEFDKLGSVIVALGNNFATTESEITAMGLRLAGAGHQVGMSEAQIMGFAAALSSVGIEAEAGGSAFSKVMVNMQLAVEQGVGAFDTLKQHAAEQGVSWETLSSAVYNGGKSLKAVSKQMGLSSSDLKKMYSEAEKASGSLQDFADVAGMSSSQFADAFKKDASGAIISFIKGLGDAEKQGKSAISVLDDMGITEVRLRDSLLRAAGASGVFTDAVNMGTKAWDQNTALAKEANTRYETVESQLKMLKNEVVDVAIEFGGPFLKALRGGVQAAKPMIQQVAKLAESFANADPKTQQMIMKLIGFGVAAGPVLKVTGTLTSGIGKLGKGFVETMAAMSKAKAITQVTSAMASGEKVALSFGQDMTAAGSSVGGLSATIGGTATKLGSLTTGFSLLNPWVLGTTAAIGAGIAVWKLWGEEAWNSSQRTQRWGTDVGKATDDALTKFKGYSQGANSEFALVEQGISGNTDSIVSNFSKMGRSIEDNMTTKIENLKGVITKLPDDIKGAAEKLTQEEVVNQEKYLNVVKENNAKITQIKQEASNNNRQISYEETVRIKALAEESATAYVQSLGKSESETKQILSAMTGNVESATKEQAQAWLQSLGQQRQQSKIEYTKMQDDLKAQLVDAGYDLNSKYAKEMLDLLKESGDSATQITEDQMSTILAKYPELADKVFLANGQLIDSMGDASKQAVDQNKKMMQSFTDMSESASAAAEENAKKIDLVANEAEEFGAFWNGLVLDPKTGEVKSNAQEAVTEAAKSEKGWNSLLFASKTADLSSNAKLMIAEAAIANGRWETMTFTEQQALIESNATKTITQALQVKGKWDGLSFDNKKAILYSNTPEVMAQAMLDAGVWQDFQPEIKELKAKNEKFLNAISQSEEKMANWNSQPADVKEFYGDNYDLLEKIYSSETAFNAWKNLPNDEKLMLADNGDFLQKILTSEGDLNRWNSLPVEQKRMLADNNDLLTKVFASEASFNAFNQLPPAIKQMLANNEDLKTKLDDGTISLETYNQIQPLLKQLLGDATSVNDAVSKGVDSVNKFNANNPENKILQGDASNVQNATNKGNVALNNFNGNNPSDKRLTGNASNVVGAAATGNRGLNTFAANNPAGKNLTAVDNASNAAASANQAVSTFSAGPSVITKTLKVVADIGGKVAKILGFEDGTNYHLGGPAIVNDQKGSTYKELVIPKGGVPFVPEGRNVLLPNLPRGSKVIKASETKRLLPHYKDGVGVPKNSSVVKNLIAVTEQDKANDFTELTSLMREMLKYLKDGNIKNLEVTQNITAGKNPTERELMIEAKRNLRDLARGFS